MAKDHSEFNTSKKDVINSNLSPKLIYCFKLFTDASYFFIDRPGRCCIDSFFYMGRYIDGLLFLGAFTGMVERIWNLGLGYCHRIAYR